MGVAAGSVQADEAPGGGVRAPTAALGHAVSWGVFAFGLALRLVHAAEIRTAPFFTYPINDSRSYDAWARRIAAGDWLGTEAFYQAPLYPYLLACVYRVLGADPFVLRCFQAVLGALACVLLAQATARLASRRAGVVAGLALAAYGPALFYDGMIGKTVVDGFLLCLALWLLARARPGATPRRWLAVGAAFGALALTRENALVFPVALVFWLLSSAVPGAREQRLHRAKARGVTAGWVLLGVFLVLFPVALRNYAVAGELHVTTSQFGPNFYIGNNPTANGRYRALRLGRSDARYERADATALAEALAGHPLAPGEVSSFWTGRAFAFIAGDPVAWSKLKLRILGYVFEATEWVDSEDLYTHAEHSRVLAFFGPALHFGVVAPLAFLGIACVAFEPVRRRRLAPLLFMAGAYAATVVAFYVFGRYRYPLVPFAIVFAAVGVTEAAVLLRRPRWQLAIVAFVVVGVAALSNLQDARRSHQQAVTAHNLARALHRDGRFPEAEAQYRRAIALEPKAYPSEARLGELLQQRGRHREAVPHFERAAVLWVRSGVPLLGLGVSYEALGDFDEALGAYLRAAEREPGKLEPHVRVGYASRNLGLYDLALASFRRAREIAPDNPAATAGAAWVLAAHPDAAQRDPERAVALASRAVERGGREPALLDALAAAVASAGDTTRATRLAREALAAAERSGRAAQAERIRARLRIYESGEAYVDAPSRAR